MFIFHCDQLFTFLSNIFYSVLAHSLSGLRKLYLFHRLTSAQFLLMLFLYFKTLLSSHLLLLICCYMFSFFHLVTLYIFFQFYFILALRFSKQFSIFLCFAFTRRFFLLCLLLSVELIVDMFIEFAWFVWPCVCFLGVIFIILLAT